MLCPGATETEFARKANIEQTLLFKVAVMKPEQVVKIAYPKIIKGKRLIIPGLYNKFLIFCSKIIPLDITNKLTMITLQHPYPFFHIFVKHPLTSMRKRNATVRAIFYKASFFSDYFSSASKGVPFRNDSFHTYNVLESNSF